jgi:hypothetical protein
VTQVEYDVGAWRGGGGTKEIQRASASATGTGTRRCRDECLWWC